MILKGLFIGNLNFLLIFLIFFLIFNFFNKIYLGDSGVYLFSIIISYIMIYGFKTKTIVLSELLCLLIIPFVDMIRLIFSRIIQFRHPFSKDKNHYHHILINKFGKKSGLLIMHLHPILSISLLYLNYQLFYIIIILNLFIYYLLYKLNLN